VPGHASPASIVRPIGSIVMTCVPLTQLILTPKRSVNKHFRQFCHRSLVAMHAGMRPLVDDAPLVFQAFAGCGPSAPDEVAPQIATCTAATLITTDEKPSTETNRLISCGESRLS
jgi:hypothetical protein